MPRHNHSYDLVNAFYHFYQAPRVAEVYNIGGSRYLFIVLYVFLEKMLSRGDYSRNNFKPAIRRQA